MALNFMGGALVGDRAARALRGGLNKAGDFLLGTEGGFQRTPAMEGYQEDIYKKLLETFSGRVGEEGERYEGDFTAEPTQAQQTAQQQLTNAFSGEGELGSAMRDIMSGRPTSQISPEQTQRYFEETVQRPMMEQQEQRQAETADQFAGPGTYWGGARADAQRETAQDFQNQMSQQLADMQYQDQQARRELQESAADRALQSQSQLSQQLAQMGSEQQQVEQRGLEQMYEDFVRTRPENQPYMDAVMQMLQIPTQHVAYQPGQQGALGDIASLAAMFA